MDLKELEAIARRELKEHGLHGWTFGLADTKRRLGVCKYRTKRIEIAEYYARNSPPGVGPRHAPARDRPRHRRPRRRARPGVESRCRPAGGHAPSCETSRPGRREPGDWQATCPACEKTAHLYRRPRSWPATAASARHARR